MNALAHPVDWNQNILKLVMQIYGGSKDFKLYNSLSFLRKSRKATPNLKKVLVMCFENFK